jgi:hypothetical protein
MSRWCPTGTFPSGGWSLSRSTCSTGRRKWSSRRLRCCSCCSLRPCTRHRSRPGLRKARRCFATSQSRCSSEAAARRTAPLSARIRPGTSSPRPCPRRSGWCSSPASPTFRRWCTTAGLRCSNTQPVRERRLPGMKRCCRSPRRSGWCTSEESPMRRRCCRSIRHCSCTGSRRACTRPGKTRSSRSRRTPDRCS